MVQLNVDTFSDIPNGKGINIECMCYIDYQVKQQSWCTVVYLHDRKCAKVYMNVAVIEDYTLLQIQ